MLVEMVEVLVEMAEMAVGDARFFATVSLVAAVGAESNCTSV